MRTLAGRCRARQVVLLSAFVACGALSGADTVELKTGERIEGFFKRATTAGVVIEVGGQSITLPLQKVAAIYFEAAKPAYKPAVTSAQMGLAAEALDAVRALRSVTESSITYREYAPRVLDAKVKVDRYLSSAKPDEAELKIPLNQASDAKRLWSAINSAMFFYQTASQKWNDWLTTDESARKISEPILGTIDQQLAKYWKMASEQVAMAEQVLAKAR